MMTEILATIAIWILASLIFVPLLNWMTGEILLDRMGFVLFSIIGISISITLIWVAIYEPMNQEQILKNEIKVFIIEIEKEY